MVSCVGGRDASWFDRMNMLAGDASGGPLMNLDGEVVGIDIARAGRIESYALTPAVILPLLAEMKPGASGVFGAAAIAVSVRRGAHGRFPPLRISCLRPSGQHRIRTCDLYGVNVAL